MYKIGDKVKILSVGGFNESFGDSTMTTQQLERSRAEFEKLLLATNEWCIANFHRADGKYCDWSLQARFEGFILRQESLVVKLPRSRGLVKINDNYSADVFESSKVISAIKSAGINYRERE